MSVARSASFVAAAAIAMLTMPVAAQTPEQFYGGKSIDLVVGYPTGGSNDTWSRVLARHIGKHVPGKPNIIVKNMPGAGSFVALNNIANVLPKDGTIIGIGAPTAPLDEKFGTANVRFKTAELNWIGRIDSLINVVFMWHISPVKTFADAQKMQSTLSGTGVGSLVSIFPTVSNNVLGTKFKLIMGYKGSRAAQLAMERGEVEGHATSWTAVKVAHPDWRPTKKVSMLVQFAMNKHRELPEVPTIIEVARNDEQRAILRAVMNASEIGTAFFTSPGVPADRVAALRRAFDATMKDPEFVAETERLKLGFNPITGEELQKLIAEVSSLPPDMVAKVRAAWAVTK